MILTMPRDADIVQLEITAKHNPNYLVVKVDNTAITNYVYENSTVVLTDLLQGQVVEVKEETQHTIEGEKPMIVDTYPSMTRISFRINSLDPLPKPTDIVASDDEKTV